MRLRKAFYKPGVSLPSRLGGGVTLVLGLLVLLLLDEPLVAGLIGVAGYAFMLVDALRREPRARRVKGG